LRLEAAIEATSKLKKKVKTAEDFADLTFNPRSTKQLRKLLYEMLNLPVLRYTDTNLPSTDGKTLDGLMAHLKKEYDL
jgi:DNA polymerase I-like protein with 3'-5' exonuclease and polymerase domains